MPRGPVGPPGTPEVAAPAPTGRPFPSPIDRLRCSGDRSDVASSGPPARGCPGSSPPLAHASLVHATFPMVGWAPAEQLQARSSHHRPQSVHGQCVELRSKGLTHRECNVVENSTREITLLCRQIHSRAIARVYLTARRQRTTSLGAILARTIVNAMAPAGDSHRTVKFSCECWTATSQTVSLNGVCMLSRVSTVEYRL